MDPILSPDGKHYVMTNVMEMRMSHWVMEPQLRSVSELDPLFDLFGSGWSVDKTTWSDDGASVSLEMRRYPGRIPPVELILYPSQNRAVVVYFDEKVLETDGMGRAMRVSYHKNGKTFEGDFITVAGQLKK